MKYYAFINGNQVGPFDAEQLIDAGVHPSTYVWCKDMNDWQRADTVEEIRNIFSRHLRFKAEVPKEQPTVQSPQKDNPAAPADTGAAPQEQIRFGRIPASVEPEVDINRPPQVSLTLAVLSLLLCFPPTGIAAVVFAVKAQKKWAEALGAEDGNQQEELKRQAHEYERMAKMWLGLTVAFGLIAWTLVFSIKN